MIKSKKIKRVHRKCENKIWPSSKYTKAFYFSYANFCDKI